MNLIEFINKYFDKDELKDILYEEELKVGGRKKELIDRIINFANWTLEDFLYYLNKDDLKDICWDFDLTVGGTKDELVDRIIESKIIEIKFISVLLDTNVLYKALKDNTLRKILFNKKLLNKIEYLISSITLQELLFVLSDKKKDDKLIDSYFKFINKNTSVIDVELSDYETLNVIKKNIKKFSEIDDKSKFYFTHSNDIINISTIELYDIDFFITYDKEIIRIINKKRLPTKAQTPEDFLISMGGFF